MIVEESVDGMDFVAGVIFADAEEGSGTDVTFRLGYYLPGKAPSARKAKKNEKTTPFGMKFSMKPSVVLGCKTPSAITSCVTLHTQP